MVFYAINGRGLGHITRLGVIARAVRELCEALEQPCELEFITTSDAPAVVEDFPVYKLPSKSSVAASRGSRERYAQRAKLILSNLVAAQAPDVLVMDTQPYGAFQELSFLRSYARATAYVYRRQDPKVATSELVQHHLPLYDRILVPDDEGNAEHYPVPRAARARVSFIGTVCSFSAARAWSRQRVREYFGVGVDERLVYVSAGGGGDGRTLLDSLVRAAARHPHNVVLAGYGPLHRGERVYARNVIPLGEPHATRFLLGVDAAISAGGYNSFAELCAAGVPTLFFAQDKGLDRQDLRIEEGARQGLCVSLPAHASAELVTLALEELLCGRQGEQVRQALARQPVHDGALAGAVELLLLCMGQREGRASATELAEVAVWCRAAAGDARFVEAARRYRRWRTQAASDPEHVREREQSASGWWSSAPATDAWTRALELHELCSAAGADPRAWAALSGAFATDTGARDQAEKLARLREVVHALGPRASELALAVPPGQLGAALRAEVDQQELHDEERARA